MSLPSRPSVAFEAVDRQWLCAVVRAVRIADYTGQETVDLSESRQPQTPLEEALRNGLLAQHMLRCRARAAGTANGDRLLRTLDEHALEPDCTPETLANILTVSVSTLSRRCRALTGRTVMRQVHHIRAHRARALLLDTALSIEEVAWEVGYRGSKGSAAFRRHFTNVAGATPSQFRRTLS